MAKRKLGNYGIIKAGASEVLFRAVAEGTSPLFGGTKIRVLEIISLASDNNTGKANLPTEQLSEACKKYMLQDVKLCKGAELKFLSKYIPHGLKNVPVGNYETMSLLYNLSQKIKKGN